MGHVVLSSRVREYNLFPFHFGDVILKPSFLLFEPRLRVEPNLGTRKDFWYRLAVFMGGIVAWLGARLQRKVLFISGVRCKL